MDGVIAVGGDIPPELDAGALAPIGAALVCRGERDDWYTGEKFEADVQRLRAAGALVRPLVFDGGHEWSDEVIRAAAIFLERVAPMIEIRSASSADAGAMAELRWEFRTSRLPPAETHDVFVKRCAPWMRRELTNGNSWRAWVAVVDKAIVGQVWLNTVHKVPNPVAELETHGYISNLYVRPSARGGLGTRLLDAALKFAQTERHRSRRPLAVAAQRDALPAPRLLARRRGHGAESIQASMTR